MNAKDLSCSGCLITFLVFSLLGGCTLPGLERSRPLPLSSAKALTSFALGSASGVVDEAGGAVAVTVPYGTDLTGMTPTIVHSGASINPPSGQPQNFTTPVAYTVTAANGTTRVYTVSVTIAPSADATLKALTVSSGTLSPAFDTATTTYTLTVANRVTEVTVTGTATDPQATVSNPTTASLVAGEPRSVGITVTAQNGDTKKKYTVTITRLRPATLTVEPLPSVTLVLSGPSDTLGGATMTVTATPSVTVDSFAWYLDGTLIAEATSAEVQLGADLAPGPHSLMVVAKKKDALFSETHYFTVQ